MYNIQINLCYFILRYFSLPKQCVYFEEFPLCWCDFISVHPYRLCWNETQRDSRFQCLVTLLGYMTKACFDWDLMGQCSSVHIHRHCVSLCTQASLVAADYSAQTLSTIALRCQLCHRLRGDSHRCDEGSFTKPPPIELSDWG